MKHRKQRNILILLVVAALLVVSAFYIYPVGKKTHLGLDLQGGLEIVYKAALPNGQTPSRDQLDQTIAIINRRVNGLGVTEATVQIQGANQISVALPGIKNVDEAVRTVGQTAQLLFFNDAKQRVSGPSDSLAAAVQQAKTQPLIALPTGAKTKIELTKLAKGQPSIQYLAVVAQPGAFGGNKGALYFVYALPPAMTGSAVKSSTQSFQQNNNPNVQITFTGKGGRAFGSITRDLAVTGQITGVNQTFAIVLDNQMESDPYIDYKQNPDGIQGTSAEIDGSFTVQQAKDLALVINTGALPVTLNQIESQEVSATLGKDSLHQALIAGLAGLGLILLYMLFYYRFLGLVADIALIIYAVLLWGLFNAIPVTLTLPGIAGMILTIGVAADANVVIFERIKEEVRRGRTVRSAVNSGYARGFRTILDANILTLLTAAVIFEFATAQPKGFAFTLILGVLVSMFTAVVATRALLGLLSDFSFFSRTSFMGVKASDIRVVYRVRWRGRLRDRGARRRQRHPARRRPEPLRQAPHIHRSQEEEVTHGLVSQDLLVRLYGPQVPVVHALGHDHRHRSALHVHPWRRQPREGLQLRAGVQVGHAYRGDVRQARDDRSGARRRRRQGLLGRRHPAGPVQERRLELPDLDGFADGRPATRPQDRARLELQDRADRKRRLRLEHQHRGRLV
jgi:protein-export membrane protein SecD